MAYNERLADRVNAILAKETGVVSKRMFGGLCYLLNGNMCCGIAGEELMVRVGKERYEEALLMKGAEPMDLTGRPLTGLVLVSAAAVQTESALRQWVQLGVDFTKTLPRKIKRPKRLRPSRRDLDD